MVSNVFEKLATNGIVITKRYVLFFLNWTGASYFISIAKTASKKIEALIHSMKFLSLEVALYIYKSTMCPCMEYCCHVWADAPSC